MHTVVIGPYGKVLEVQIRTKEMHKMAELGIAAHWRYKEGDNKWVTYDEKINYLRQIIGWQNELISDAETEEALKTELFEDRIFVFTPKGDIIDLPKGATAIDLAYHIHTNIGHRCRGAKENGKIIPISQPLTNGMQVEILTVKDGGPSRDWLNSHIKCLITAKAKAKIHQWFKHQDVDKNLQLGRDIINREFKRLGIAKVNLKELAAAIINSNSEEELLAGLGSGEIRITKLFDALQQLNYVHILKAKQDNIKTILPNKPQASTAAVIIDGMGGLKYHIAKCCFPRPNDEIIGYITLGNYVSIHRKDCLNILQNAKTKHNRLITVTWGYGQQHHYLLTIHIKAHDRKGLLRDVTTVLADEGADVVNVNNFIEQETHILNIKININITNMNALSTILFRIQQIANVIDVCREPVA